jgi:hypothetical protein
MSNTIFDADFYPTPKELGKDVVKMILKDFDPSKENVDDNDGCDHCGDEAESSVMVDTDGTNLEELRLCSMCKESA